MKNYIWKLFTDFVERISRTHTFHAHFSLLFTIWAMAAGYRISSTSYHHVNPTGSANVALIYILTIIMISYHTDKYRYGIISWYCQCLFYKLPVYLSVWPVQLCGVRISLHLYGHVLHFHFNQCHHLPHERSGAKN